MVKTFLMIIFMLSYVNAQDSIHTETPEDSLAYIEEDSTYDDSISRNEIVKHFILNSKPNCPKDSLDMIANAIVEESDKYDNVSYTLLSALITKESNFDPKIKSEKKAKGLGQLIQSIAKFACDSLKIKFFKGIEYNPVMNIKMTAWFLNWCIEKEKGSLELGLAHYNGGPRNAWRYKCFMKKENKHKITGMELIGVMNLSPETKSYVSKVKLINDQYSKLSEIIRDTADMEEFGYQE
jgi:hypothetical protein